MALLVATPATPVGARDVQRRRAEVRAEVHRVRSRESAVRRVRADDAAVFSRADRRVDRVAHAVVEAQRSVRRQRREVGRARQRLAGSRRRADRRREVMGDRLAWLYMSGSNVPFASLLASEGPQQAVRRSGYAAAISRADTHALDRAVRARDAVAARRRALVAERGRLRAALQGRRNALLAAARQRRRSRLVLVASTRRLDRLRVRETHLESESRGLAGYGGGTRVVALRADRSTRLPTQADTVDGSWTWPASGPVTSGFGMRWGSLHAGIDIGAPEGAPIVAASDGVVSQAGYMSGYGNIVLVDHGGGVTTAYAHQSAVATTAGAQVRAGDHIGSVGSTGNVTGPHLHFEVRVGGSPVDPTGYLP